MVSQLVNVQQAASGPCLNRILGKTLENVTKEFSRTISLT